MTNELVASQRSPSTAAEFRDRITTCACTSLLRYYDAVLCHCSVKEKIACCEEDLVLVRSNGTCIWWRPFQLSITECPMDITWFPVDKQNCELIVGSKNYESKLLTFTAASPAVELFFFQQNPEWHLNGKTANLLRWSNPGILCSASVQTVAASALWNFDIS